MTDTRAYTVSFERIGRNHDVEPLQTTAADADALAEAIYRHARPHLASHDVDVLVNLDEHRGSILVGGFRSGGRFTIDSQP